MSKQKLVFRVGTGLAVTGLALSMGTGCPKDTHTVNPVPPANNQQPEQPQPPPPPVNVNTVASPPVDPRALDPVAADAGSADAGTADADEAPRPKMKEPIRVNTPPPKDL